MASFKKRASKEKALKNVLNEGFLEQAMKIEWFRLRFEQAGYEARFSEEEQEKLKRRSDEEALGIRFNPDAEIIPDDSRGEPRTFLEYKSMTTPRYTLRDRQWDEGQVEADAWENYVRLTEEGSRVALLVCCPYHPRVLLCEYVSKELLTRQRSEVRSTTVGSRTDYVNIDLTKMRSMTDFFVEEYKVPRKGTASLVVNMMKKVLDDPSLQTSHHKNSQYHGTDEAKTGFNWVWPSDDD